MDKLSPDQIAHLTEGQRPNDKDHCPHHHIAEVTPATAPIYICLDCGMETTHPDNFHKKR